MTDDAVGQFRRLGVALIVGGAVVAALSFVVPAVLVAGVLLFAAFVIRFEFAEQARPLNLGPALAILALLVLLEELAGIGGFGGFEVGILVAVAGIFEIVAAPWLARYMSTEEE